MDVLRFKVKDVEFGIDLNNIIAVEKNEVQSTEVPQSRNSIITYLGEVVAKVKMRRILFNEDWQYKCIPIQDNDIMNTSIVICKHNGEKLALQVDEIIGIITAEPKSMYDMSPIVTADCMVIKKVISVKEEKSLVQLIDLKYIFDVVKLGG